MPEVSAVSESQEPNSSERGACRRRQDITITIVVEDQLLESVAISDPVPSQRVGALPPGLRAVQL